MRECGLIDRLNTATILDDLRSVIERGDGEELFDYVSSNSDVILRSLDDAILALDENRTYADRMDSYKDALKHTMKWKELAVSALGIIQDYTEE